MVVHSAGHVSKQWGGTPTASKHALPLVRNFPCFLASLAPNGEGQGAEAQLGYLGAALITVAISEFPN